MSKTGLGRGLSALIAEQEAARPAAVPDTDTIAANDTPGEQHRIALESIAPWDAQPRRHFDDNELAELAESIKQNGVVQPIIVRATGDGAYEIVAGERRFRAAQLAGLSDIPAVIMALDDKQALEISLVENIQRRDLSPLEVADGYQRLMKEYSYTQENLAEVLGKSRSQVSNTLRLLSLPDAVKAYLQEEKLSFGHARALSASKHAAHIADMVVKRGLNVRQTEALVQKAETFPIARAPRKTVKKPPEMTAWEEAVKHSHGLDIRCELRGTEAGRVVITFDTLPQLERLMTLLEPRGDLPPVGEES